jgi:hypothetical protein
MKKNKYIKYYRIIGSALCGIAGGIIGFVTGGIGLAILCIFPGFFIGHAIERALVRAR